MKDAIRKISRYFRFHAITLFRMRGSSERIARGAALGAAVNVYPTFGVGVGLAAMLAGLTGGNVVAGLVGAAVFTALWPLLFFLNVKVGERFYPATIVVDELEDITAQTVDALILGKTFLLGAGINAVWIGLLTYGLVYFSHKYFREHVLSWFRENNDKGDG